MRKYLMFLFLFFSFFYAWSSEKIIETQIRYNLPYANEVYMVWGINNWQLPPKVDLIADSYTKGSLVYTKMKKIEKDFVVSFNLPKGCTIDYCFNITKGPFDAPIDKWDTNYGASDKDYHSIANENVIAIIKANPNFVSIGYSVTFISFGIKLLLLMISLVLIHFTLRKFFFKRSFPEINSTLIIIGVSISLFLISLPLRSSVTGSFSKFLVYPSEILPIILKEVFYDGLLLLFTTLLFLALIRLFNSKIWIKNLVFSLYIVFCSVYLIAETLNVKIVEMLGLPFNYRWLAYSGFLKSTDAKNALFSNVDVKYAIETLATILLIIPLTYFAIHSLVLLKRIVKIKRIWIFATVFIISFFFFSKPSEADKFDYNKIANPVWVFVESISPFSSSIINSDSDQVCELAIKNPQEIDQKFKNRFDSVKIKNVLIFVNESTPAEYIGLYNKKYNVTPVLDSYYNQSIVFQNIYAHAPATNKSLVSLHAAINPWLSYYSLTEAHPDIKLPNIQSVLKSDGYRTAFFNSGDNEFQSTNKYLKAHDFELTSDFKNNNCPKKLVTGYEASENFDGSDDECLASSCLNWIDQNKEKPFFTTLWTFQTHYPYFASGSEKDYQTGDANLNKYLNGLNNADKTLGKIIDGLKARGLFESTLIVVTGDHGEAFGRHDQTTHARNIFEENLHIPLVLINPMLFKGEWNKTLGAISDISPTILSVLGKTQPETWQGESLFNNARHNSVYFYAPWSDYWFGYRQDNIKYLYNASTDKFYMFDLNNDPQEMNNLADQNPEQIKIAKNKLAAWVKYQNEYINGFLAGN